MSRNSNSMSMRDRCLYLGGYFFQDPRMKRLKGRDHGFKMAAMYMIAFANAMESGGVITKDPRLSLEEHVAILIDAADDEIDDVRNMLQACREEGMIVDDGKTIDFEGCWDLP